jgi:hypothetical protein
VTGDQHAIAVETSRRLGLGTDIMDGSELMGLEGAKGIDAELAARVDRVDGFAGVYPEHKFLIVEALQVRRPRTRSGSGRRAAHLYCDALHMHGAAWPRCRRAACWWA